MTKQWRPENWNNPWDKNHIVYFDEANAVAHLKNGIYITAPFRIEKEFAYEEGADAMLKILREMGNTKGGRVNGEEAHIRGNGVWVFIEK